ncbi:MAG: hypothetical protein M1150_04590 [Patescibacteria group bacterium]|nr:hypothetical protein [Patescibacteria group bacterium]
MNTSLIITGLTIDARFERAKELGQKLSNQFDLFVVNAEVNGGIETIREIQKMIARTPYSSEANVVIIKEAQNLTLEAQNAFLKSLEEPPEKSLLILTAPSTDGFLTTVISRCHVRHLGEVKKEIEKETEEKASQEILSLLRANYGERLLAEIEINLDAWLLWWRELMWKKINPEENLTSTSLHLNLKQVVDIIVKVEETKNLLERSVNKKLALDVLLLSLPKIGG